MPLLRTSALPCSPCRYVVGQAGQLHCDIQRDDLDPFGGLDLARGKIQDALDAYRHQLVHCRLRGSPRNGYNRQADITPLKCADLLDRLDRDAVDHTANLLRVHVEGSDNIQTICGKPGIRQQGRAQITDSHQGRPPDRIQPKDLLDLPGKPLDVVADLVQHTTGTVYDPFLGSGTTLVACEQTGRVGYGMEIEPKYCAVTLERLAGMGLEPQRVTP